MISTTQREATDLHPLARFVTKEAIALLLNLKPEDIYRIDCWRYVIHVVGKGVSTFISYADLPPILGVEPPTNQDFVRWRKRWKQNKKQAPKFWVEFYKEKFWQAVSVAELYMWGQIVRVIKFALSQAAVQGLRSVFLDAKYSLQPF
jgi:hypothetical protein